MRPVVMSRRELTLVGEADAQTTSAFGHVPLEMPRDDELVTATENLLARKAKLLRQLGNGSSDAERDEIERQIAQIDTALDLLEALGARTDHKKR
jgi:hypothetical protein